MVPARRARVGTEAVYAETTMQSTRNRNRLQARETRRNRCHNRCVRRSLPVSRSRLSIAANDRNHARSYLRLMTDVRSEFIEVDAIRTH
jgi:hypothetical protein